MLVLMMKMSGVALPARCWSRLGGALDCECDLMNVMFGVVTI